MHSLAATVTIFIKASLPKDQQLTAVMGRQLIESETHGTNAQVLESILPAY
jgi:hypothetical protein